MRREKSKVFTLGATKQLQAIRGGRNLDMNGSSPTDKDVAEFFWHGLRLELVDSRSVVAWADEIVASREDRPNWAIELGMGDAGDLCDLLSAVPGEPNDALLGLLLSTRIARLLREQRLSWEEAWAKGHELSKRGVLPSSAEYFEAARKRFEELGLARLFRSSHRTADWSEIIGFDWDLYHIGSLTNEQMSDRVDQRLAQFLQYEVLLPESVRDPDRIE